jgi:hypothetical protein
MAAHVGYVVVTLLCICTAGVRESGIREWGHISQARNESLPGGHIIQAWSESSLDGENSSDESFRPNENSSDESFKPKNRAKSESLVPKLDWKTGNGNQVERARSRNFHELVHRHRAFLTDTLADETRKRFAMVALTVCILGPVLVYLLLWQALIFSTRECRRRSRAFEVLTGSLQGLIFVLSALFTSDVSLRCVDFQGHRWIQLEAQWLIGKILCFVLGWGLLTVLRGIHELVQGSLAEKDENYYKRREFMNMISNPTGIEPVGDMDNAQEEVIYNRVWIPVYFVTNGVVWLETICALLDYGDQMHNVAMSYIFFLVFGSIFGAGTVGKDIYSGMILLLEKPFEVGDIVSIEDKCGAGGCVQTLVTGFVERMSVRSTIIRRFDMRACVVPNATIVENMASNWERPRKLISIEVALSHRSPLEAVKKFSDAAQNIVKNHKDVDQQLYTKACFRKLENGLNFRIICYNARGTKKQFVQQDLIYRISGLARSLDVAITFCETSHQVVKLEQSSEQGGVHYLPDSSACLEADLSAIVPKKKAAETPPKQAPDNFLIIRLETATGLGGLLPPDFDLETLHFFTKVIHGDAQPHVPRSGQPSGAAMDFPSKAVRFHDTFEIKCSPWPALECGAVLQVFVKGPKKVGTTQRPWLIAQATVDLSKLVSLNLETTLVSLSLEPPPTASFLESLPSATSSPLPELSGECATIGIRVFVGANLAFRTSGSHRSSDGIDSISEDSMPDLQEGSMMTFEVFERTQSLSPARRTSLQDQSPTGYSSAASSSLNFARVNSVRAAIKEAHAAAA